MKIQKKMQKDEAKVKFTENVVWDNWKRSISLMFSISFLSRVRKNRTIHGVHTKKSGKKTRTRYWGARAQNYCIFNNVFFLKQIQNFLYVQSFSNLLFKLQTSNIE